VDIRFAYWVPNVSGGLVVSKIPQRTDWSFDYNAWLAREAERAGFDYGLVQARYFASYGAEYQLEAVSTAAGLAAATQRLKLIAAVHPGLWHPAVLAKVGATIDLISRGRFAVNIVSGWFKQEFTGFGLPWLEHDERYLRSEEFGRVLRGLWSGEPFTFRGRFYHVEAPPLKPGPVQNVPEIFLGGNSKAARRVAAAVADWYFMNGNTLDGLREQIEEVSALAAEAGRRVRFGVNAFVICRKTEEEAREELRGIIEHADREAVEAFREQVKQAGKSSPEGKGMWANSTFEDLVQYNDGFRTGLIGTPETIAAKIQELHAIGVDLVLCGFLHYSSDLAAFGKEVIPLVRQLPPARKAESAVGA